MYTLTIDQSQAHPRREWVNPLTLSLQMAVEPNCNVCACSMDSWDMYFDHIIFDQTHKINEFRLLNERHNRLRLPVSPQNRSQGQISRQSSISQSPVPSQSSLHPHTHAATRPLQCISEEIQHI